MKMLPPSLATHVQGTLSTLAYLLKIVRTNGTTLAFTTHDNPLLVDGVTYKAADSFLMSGLENPTGLAPENAEMLGLISSGSLCAPP